MKPDGEPLGEHLLPAKVGRPQWQASNALIHQGTDGAEVWAWLVQTDEPTQLAVDVRLCLNGMHLAGFELMTASHPSPRSCLLTFRLTAGKR